MSLEMIRQRLEAATPGPWEQRHGQLLMPPQRYEVIGADGTWLVTAGDNDYGPAGGLYGADNAALIAHAPTDLKLLLAVAEAAKALRYIVTYHDPGIPGEDGYVGDPPLRPGCHPDCDAVEAFKAALDALEAAP